MQITRKSLMSGITRTLEIPISREHLDRWLHFKTPLSHMTDLSQEEIEFITTGITNDDWALAFSKNHQEQKDAFNAQNEFSEQEPIPYPV